MRRLLVITLLAFVWSCLETPSVSWAVDWMDLLESVSRSDGIPLAQTSSPSKSPSPHGRDLGGEMNYGPMIVFLFLIATVLGFYFYMRNKPATDTPRKRKRH